MLVSAQTTEVEESSNKGGNSNTRTNNAQGKWPTNPTKKNKTTTNNSGHMDMTPVAPINIQHAHKPNLDT